MFRTPQVDDLNVVNQVRLVSPERLHDELPLSEAAKKNVLAGRDAIKRILDRADPRLFVVVGPCSIHDPQAALDYGRRLAALAKEIADTMFLVMRVYFEKPRTTVGWKGLVNDPDLDDSFHIEKGLRIARRLLLDLNELGLPCGTEALDPITPQYLADLVSWSAIGARTTESQTHREMASGLSMPVGIKNGTDGSRTVAINALLSVSQPHAFLGIDPEGRCALTYTRGNKYAHIVLRGGAAPNYDTASVTLTEQELERAGLPRSIMVDCSHGNSGKDPARQPLVFADVVHQIVEGNRSIVGAMIESNLEWGNQPLVERSKLRYGVSITDACIDWPTTERTLREAGHKLSAALSRR
ncbi:MAG: 3-deoxy-7-phosphoheptulonate synthase [Betaproteobacteria bacterium RIFCSPHIGHO2_12_FULL_69_13]|nr:MAG: 3-deoxy-7-phosphoheptulonate synthase [Betaproteobacteria bacterium RIFCSPHIGHO2_12_FULL_69_13]OGA64280.1 MAG: 3-deoxy-7-phosphoheptulonate synthase [Betaproteobacteria bacterium RIFCSPLOWO2_12_FULL_68_20]